MAYNLISSFGSLQKVPLVHLFRTLELSPIVAEEGEESFPAPTKGGDEDLAKILSSLHRVGRKESPIKP